MVLFFFTCLAVKMISMRLLPAITNDTLSRVIEHSLEERIHSGNGAFLICVPLDWSVCGVMVCIFTFIVKMMVWR